MVHRKFFLLISVIYQSCYFIKSYNTNNCRPKNYQVRLKSLFASPYNPSSSSGRRDEEIFASQLERRKEEKRRLERKKDVMIGKTSAIPGENDYELYTKKTEVDYLAASDDVTRQIYIETERGMDCFRLLQLEEASEAFEKVYSLKPDAYVFHAGVTLFYLDKIEEAGQLSVKNAFLYESKFGLPATEERIWRDACELKLLSQMTKKELKKYAKENGVLQLLPSIPDPTPDQPAETRKVFRFASKLFGASVKNDMFNVILYRANLLSLGSSDTKNDPKLWKFNSLYYLGLHYDAIGNTKESRFFMKKALTQSISGGDNIKYLPIIHMTRRDWFDNGEVEEQEDFSQEKIIQTIEKDCNALPMSDLLRIMKLKGKESYGLNKEALQKRSFELLVEEFLNKKN